MGKKEELKICLAASAGGHLSELMQLQEFYSKYNHFFVSDERSNAISLKENEKVYFVKCPRRNPFKLTINFFQSLKVLFKEKPNVIISTGADTAIPTCILGKLLGKKIIFIESFARIKEASISGKIMYPLADLFFVQWEENKEFFPKAIYAGSVF